ncbi:steryl-sulfatase isoform X1 [Pelobates cultripes]|nr:steryl-sulfatase isoform X1 [Pelobates cultripes]
MASRSRVGVFIFSASSGGLPNNEITFATMLKKRGYSTGLIGKWHLGLNCENSSDHCHHPVNYGFDYFYGMPMTNLRDCIPGHGSVFLAGAAKFIRTLIQIGCITLVTATLLNYSGIIKINWKVVSYILIFFGFLFGLVFLFFWNFRYLNCFLMRNHQIIQQPFKHENLTQRMTKESVDFIRRNKYKPFLLFVSFAQVHTALYTEQRFRGKSKHGLYGDAIEEVDWSVGKI